ncbi:MAG: Hsp33 family molecular chaperone HslO [Firmicutes bacterium]|nr:Hsp33 family molecular chaperone HslO [Bacillota bacterium]
MEDFILRATAANGFIRAFAVHSTKTVEEARRIHDTTPVATAALGRLISAAAMMGATLKNEKDRLTLQIKGDGPLEGLLVTSDANVNVKGYVFNPQADVPEIYPGKLEVGMAVGHGSMRIIKDIGLREPYCGTIELISGEIAEDLTYYFAKSEQIPSAVGLGVLVDMDRTVRQAGGFFVQLMPGAPDEVIDKLEDNINRLPYTTDLMDMGKTIEEILGMILTGFEYEVNDKLPLNYLCDCSKERVEQALISIGAKDLAKIAQEDKKAEISCHFCNKKYEFNEEELMSLLAEALED